MCDDQDKGAQTKNWKREQIWNTVSAEEDVGGLEMK
jgi:hypothetical protein